MNTTQIYLVFAIGNTYEPRTLVGAARTWDEAFAIQRDHMGRKAPMANGSQIYPMSTYPAAAEQLLAVTNPFPQRVPAGY